MPAGDYDKAAQIADLRLNFTSADFETIFEFFGTVSTSVAVDSAGKTYIAYSDSIGGSLPRRTFRISEESVTNSWTRISQGLGEPNTHNFSIAAGPNDRPVVAYSDEPAHRTMVYEWNGSAWNVIGNFASPSNTAASVTQDINSRLILACEAGIFRWDGTGVCTGDCPEEGSGWESLGNPGVGSGDPSWWIGSNGNIYAVAFLGTDNRVHVKMRYINE